jgi:hypothetical protein
MRVHKFAVRWDLCVYLLTCLVTLTPFIFTGRRIFALVPLVVWAAYNALFLLGPQPALKWLRGVSPVEFTATMEEFFSPKVRMLLCDHS